MVEKLVTALAGLSVMTALAYWVVAPSPSGACSCAAYSEVLRLELVEVTRGGVVVGSIASQYDGAFLMVRGEAAEAMEPSAGVSRNVQLIMEIGSEEARRERYYAD